MVVDLNQMNMVVELFILTVVSAVGGIAIGVAFLSAWDVLKKGKRDVAKRRGN